MIQQLTTDGSDATAATADTADFFQTLIQVARNEQLFKFKILFQKLWVLFYWLQTSTHRLALFTIPYVSCLISLLNFFLSMIFLALSACLLGRSQYCISVLREWNKSWSLLSLKQEKIRSWFCCKKKIKWPLSLLLYCLITFRAAIRPHLLVINGFKIKKQLLSSFSVSLPEIVLIKIEIIWN